MNNMIDAQPNDIYVDGNGRLWRVMWLCSEPMVCLSEIESDSVIAPNQKEGGVSGAIWEGFKRIYRP